MISAEDSDGRERLFRMFATNAVENSQKAVQAVWVVLFSGGTAALISAFDRFLTTILSNKCAKDAPYISDLPCPLPRDMHTNVIILSISLCFVCYILTFYRFYVGNIRVYDMRYTEVKKFIEYLAKENEKKTIVSRELINSYFSYVDRNAAGENIFLMIQTITIISLTLATTNPSRFVYLYFFLLIVDVPYLVRSRPTNFFFDIVAKYSLVNVTQSILESFKRTFPTYALKTWRINNFAFSALLAFEELLKYKDVLHLKDGEMYVFIQIVTILGNCFVDLIMSWRFYNPKMSETYRGLLQVLSAEPSNDAGRG